MHQKDIEGGIEKYLYDAYEMKQETIEAEKMPP